MLKTYTHTRIHTTEGLIDEPDYPAGIEHTLTHTHTYLLLAFLQYKSSKQKTPLYPSYLMGFAPQSASWTAAWPQGFFLASLSALLLPLLPLLYSFSPHLSSVVLKREKEKVREKEGGRETPTGKREGENICVDPPASSVIFMVLFVFLHWFQFSQVSSSSYYFSPAPSPSLPSRHIKWRGHSWSRWIQMTPQTTTGLSRNQWVSKHYHYRKTLSFQTRFSARLMHQVPYYIHVLYTVG